MLENIDLAKILVKAKVFRQAELNKYKKEAKEKKMSLADFLIADKIIDEPKVFEKIASDKYKVPFIDFVDK